MSLVRANYYDLMSILEFQPSILASSACRQSQRFHKLIFLASEPRVMRYAIDSKVKSSLFILFEGADRTIGCKRLVKHR